MNLICNLRIDFKGYSVKSTQIFKGCRLKFISVASTQIFFFRVLSDLKVWFQTFFQAATLKTIWVEAT